MDIADPKFANESLQRSDERNRAILRAIPDLMFVQTADGVYLDYQVKDARDLLVPPSEFLGKNMREVLPPELSERLSSSFRLALETDEPQAVEYRMTLNGEERWYEARIVTTEGDKMLSVVREITDRKRAEEALHESEARFRNMADNAPVMIWMAGVDKLCTYFNQQWLVFSGRTIEEELGIGWADGVHPEDYARCIETYNDAFDRREKFTMEYRLRRADREFRWLLDTGTPRFSPTGEFLGYMGSCIDITERKAAEESLKNLSGQLIRAREDECARIARELHDDVIQRMTLMSFLLEQLEQGASGTNGNMSEQLTRLMKQAREVSREIHRISHDLHPSRLVYLGLVASVQSLCDELHQVHRLRIGFTHDGVPARLPQEISLCLYRIAQECLNNVIKHSGARDATVTLRGTGTEIVLRVSDPGRGFDADSPAIKKGLGLVSMKERLRLVGGTISVESRPSQGTQVTASVPLSSAAQ
jgi:PAS domain S-box-containing protein